MPVPVDTETNLRASVKRGADGKLIQEFPGPETIRKDNFPDRGIHPPGTVRPKDTNPSVAEAMKSTEFSFGCETRAGLLDPIDVGKVTGTAYWNDGYASFEKPVWSFHAHHYFDHTNPESIKEALELRTKVLEAFPDLTVNKPFRGPVGPHPIGNWECEMYTPAQLAKYLPWLVTHHGNLSVLVHPNTGKGFKDHTVDGYWIGDPSGDLPAIQEGVKARFKKMMASRPELRGPDSDSKL